MFVVVGTFQVEMHGGPPIDGLMSTMKAEVVPPAPSSPPGVNLNKFSCTFEPFANGPVTFEARFSDGQQSETFSRTFPSPPIVDIDQTDVDIMECEIEKRWDKSMYVLCFFFYVCVPWKFCIKKCV